MQRRRTGTFVALGLAVLFVVFFVVGQARDAFTERTTVYVDFVMTSGLREGSPVQLAGVKIGQVSAVDYVTVRYACDPLTEDIGRYGAGRTDNCDKRLSCMPTGECGNVEPTASDHSYTRCVHNGDCQTDEVCMTSELRRREPRMLWLGPHGVCARFNTEHRRVRIEMTLEAQHLELIRRDSRASISANSVLGDQLINITQGIGDPVGAGDRVLSEPSLAEDVELYRVRLERALLGADEALSAVSGLVAELGDERTLDALKGLITNLESISELVATRQGVVGALVGEPSYKRDFGQILHAIGGFAGGVDSFVGRGNRILATVDRNLDGLLDDVRATTKTLRILLEELQAPENRSIAALLLDDPDGSVVMRLESILDQAEGIVSATEHLATAIDGEKGTVGKVLGDPKLADDLGRLLDNLKNEEFLVAVMMVVLEGQGVGVKSAQDPAKPPKAKRRRAKRGDNSRD